MLECSTYFWNEKSGRWVFQDKEEFWTILNNFETNFLLISRR
jgi:hypothetical protein